MNLVTEASRQSIRLGDAAAFIRGITFKPDDVVEPGTPESVVCMRTKNVQADLDQGDLIAVPKRFVKNGSRYLRAGDVLVSTANSFELVGKCCWVPELEYTATAGGFISIFRADTSILDCRYFYHWLSSPRIQFKLRWCGRQTTNISNLNFSIASEIQIPFPPLAEQRRIAAILDKADAIRRKRREALAKTDTFLRSVFLDMFGDPAENPNAWPIRPLGECTELLTGFAFTSKDYCAVGTRLCRGANVLPDRIDWSDVRYWPEHRRSEFERYELEAGDVVIAMDRPWISTGLKVAQLLESDLPALLVQRVTRLRPRDGLGKAYLFQSIRHQAFTRHCSPKTTETLVPHISPLDIRSYEIPIPPAEHILRFEQIAECGRNAVERAKAAVSEAGRLFEALVQRAFQGEL